MQTKIAEEQMETNVFTSNFFVFSTTAPSRALYNSVAHPALLPSSDKTDDQWVYFRSLVEDTSVYIY